MPKILDAPETIFLPSLIEEGEDFDRDFSRFDGYLGRRGVLYLNQGNRQKVTATMQVQPPRTDIGSSSFEQRPDFGDFFAQGDFAGGMGQRYYHRPERNETAFFDGEGYDVSVRGQLTHLSKAVLLEDVDLGSPSKIEAGTGTLWAVDGENLIKSDNGVGWSIDEDFSANINDIAVNGSVVYAAVVGAGIQERDPGDGSWSSYASGGDYDGVAFVKDRIIAWETDAIFEPAGGAPGTAIDSWNGGIVHDVFESGEFIMACVEVNGRGYIYTYGSNEDLSALERKSATKLPDGDIAYCGLGYLGRTFIGCGRARGPKNYPVLFEAGAGDAGQLQLLQVFQGEPGEPIKRIGNIATSVIFSWSEENGRTGLGAYHLPRNALQKHLLVDTDQGDGVNGLAVFYGSIYFTADGKMYREDVGNPVDSAYLISSLADWNGLGFKAWDQFEVLHDPLGVGQTVTLEFSRKTPEEDEWALAVTSALQGSTGSSERVEDLKFRQLSVRLSSTADQGLAPTVRAFSVRSTPSPEHTEWQIVRVIRIVDRDRKNLRAEKVISDPRDVRSEIADLSYSWVTLYEPGVTWVCYVQSVAELEPNVAPVSETKGTSEREVYFMELTMVGRRT